MTCLGLGKTRRRLKLEEDHGPVPAPPGWQSLEHRHVNALERIAAALEALVKEPRIVKAEEKTAS